MDAFMRMVTGKEERTIADRISDPNRPTWEQYKKENADKLDLNDNGEKEMKEYRKKLDATREKVRANDMAELNEFVGGMTHSYVTVGREWQEAAAPRRGRKSTRNAPTHPRPMIRAMRMSIGAQSTKAGRKGESFDDQPTCVNVSFSRRNIKQEKPQEAKEVPGFGRQ